MNSLFICHVQTRLSVVAAFAVLKSAAAYHNHSVTMIVYIYNIYGLFQPYTLQVCGEKIFHWVQLSPILTQ